MDIKSKNVLKQALQNFEGTLIIVSHDRDFLQGLTDKVYEFKDKQIKEFLGDIDFYLEYRNATDFREVEKSNNETKTTSTSEKKSEEKISYEQQKQQKTLQNKLNKVEKSIDEIEKEIEKK
ncbi:hypothetical protein CCAN11_2470010 [Capnocytophaga canimorsus]|uniref:ABC transporter ATP-binding protein n=1 Tax=Capnocytophaga canimorsus TaxID=28188 RepID=A0A0B7IRA6_9FLAO|nr:hypothetical protein CCAN11_2470010 [Capnocytophaga canimorsus]